VRLPPLEDSDVVIRVLERHGGVVAASPAFLERHFRPRVPEDLTRLDCLAMTRPGGEPSFPLTRPDGALRVVPIRARLVTDDLARLSRAALDGAGIAFLPHFLVEEDLAAGTLEMLLPESTSPSGIVHAVFPSRRGLIPAVRVFIDRLAAEFGPGGG
jgi:DNA-binding transcriptional LysR family regulator